MKDEIIQIAYGLENELINEDEAKKLLLDLFLVSKSVFIVCENDDYGRDLYLDTKNTREEADELKGRITSRNIYEHET